MKQFNSNEYVQVPIAMCYYVLRNKLISQFQLYILLKLRTDGIDKLPPQFVRELAKELNRTPRTIRNNTKKLINLNWVSHNPHTGTYFIRGFEKVRQQYKLTQRSSTEIYRNDLREIRAFLAGAIITNLINNTRRLIRGVNARHCHRAIQFITPYSSYYPVANLALAKILGISISSASYYKSLAVNMGYVKRKRFNLTITRTDVSRNIVLEGYPDIAHLFAIKNNQLVVNRPDQFKSNMRLRRRKKIDTYNCHR